MPVGIEVIEGDATTALREMPAGIARCCVTSPPYFAQRDYGMAGQIGLEDTPREYVERLVGVFREVRRVLADDGTLWLNLGDTYATPGGHTKLGSTSQRQGRTSVAEQHAVKRKIPPGFKYKDLLGIPWRVAIALQEDGWYLRADIIFEKTNSTPENVTDRPTRSHEYVFLLSKRKKYYYDAAAVRERGVQVESGGPETRNCRSVWRITLRPFKGAHFAVMPTELIRPCVRAGSAAGDLVLDPFGGSGTTAVVAAEEGRRAIVIELNPAYVEVARRRIADSARNHELI